MSVTIDQPKHPVPDPETPPRTLSSRKVYGAAAIIFAVAVVLAALGVGEKAGRLSDWQALALGVVRARPSCCRSRRRAT
jgi:hypothetical protein